MDKTDNPLLSGAASFLGVAPDAKPTDVLISPTFKPASDAFDEDETVRRRARGIAAAKNLFSTDVSKLDDAQLSGLYQATAKALFDIEDTDGKVAFGKKAGKPRQNIELLRQFCRGDYKVIQDDEYQSWAQMDEEQKFRYALEKEGTRNKVKSYIRGERGAGLLENLAAGAQYSGIGLPPGAMSVARQTTGNDKLEQDAQTVLMESARRSNYETLTPEEKAAYRADVIDDYDKKLSKRQALATYLAMKDGLSDRASMLLAKAFNTGSVDVDEMEALKPLDRDRAYTALSIMRGDQKKGRLFTTLWMNEQDFTDETNWNRFQLGLYGLQQSIFALATDTWDIGKGAVKWTYAKMLLDEAQRKRYFDRWDAETRAEQALKQGLPEAEGAFGEGFQSLMENIHWFIPYGMIGKGGKLMRASAGVAEDAKWYKKLAVTFTPWKFGSNEKLVEEIQKAGLEIAKARHAHSLDTLDRIHRAMGTTEFAAENTVLARQAANVELYTKALQEAQKAVKAAKASGYAGLSMYAAGEASAFSAFANEYIANCDAAGVSREDSVPMAAAIGWINAKIEKIYVPGLESGLSRSEVKSLMFSSLLNAIRTDGMTGARQWLGNRVRYGISEGIKVALEEGAIEEPLQQIVSEHGKSIAATSQKLRENGQGDLADQLTAYWDSIKDTAAHDFKTYIDTAIDMIPSSVGFGLTTVGNQTRRQHIENAWRRHANRVKYENAVEEAKKSGLPIPTAPTMFSPGPGGTIQLNPDGLDVDLGVADIVGKATQVRKMIREHWDGTDASAESGALAADPNGVTKAIAAARKAWDAGEGDVVRKIADAAAVDYKTAEALSDYFTKEAQAALGSPNVKNFIAHDLSTVDFSEETMAKVLPGYVRGSFVHDEEKGVYSGKVTLPNGETKTIAYVYGDISDKLSALVDEQSKVDSNLGKSHDARVKSGTESGKLWSEMDEADRRAYAIRQVNALSTGSGCFTVTDKKGEEIIINADDVIYLSNGELGNVGYGAMATMGTVRHETWHSIWRFVSSELSSDDKQKLAKTLGVDVTAEGWEADLDEAMAYQFEQYASGNYVNHAVDGLVSGFVDSATGKMVRQLSKIGLADEIKNPKTGKAYALADFYDAVLRGQIGTGRLGYAQTEAPAAEAPKAEKKRSTTSEIPVEVKAEEVDAAEEEAAKASEKTEPEAPPPPAAPKVEHTLDNPADASVPDARFYRISAGDGVTLVGELVVSDASQLKTSYKGNLSDPKLQNRGETKEGASLVEKIAGRPDALQVGTIQPRANNGFVWTTPSLDVFIGNTRSTGVTFAYERGNGAGVDAHMRAEAQKRGIEIPEGVKSPVVHFVLRKIESEGGKADIYDVVRMTNESVNRGMNKYEQAKNDADVLVNNNIVPGIVLNAEGDVDTAKSSDAIGAFRQLTGAQGLVDENTDLLSEEGQERIKNAVLASLLKDADPSLMAKLVSQSEHLDIENEKSALMRMSSELMRLAAAKPQYDLRAPIVEALEYYTEWRDRDEKLRAEAGKDRRSWTEKTTDGKRKRGLTWEHHMGQGDMFRTPSQEARMIGDLLAAARELRSFDKEDNESSAGKKRAQDLIGSYLADYMANAHAVNTETEDMFGTPPPTRAELMTQHRTKDGAARFSTAGETDTPQFKAWFGKSKMVDADGKPRIFWHGTNWDILKEKKGRAVFSDSYRGTGSGDMGFFGRGHYFAYTEGEASYYGRNVIPVFLRIENPFDFQKELDTLWGKRTALRFAGRLAPAVNLAEKFPEIAKECTATYMGDETGIGEYELKEISLADFAKEAERVHRDVKFEIVKIENSNEVIVRAEPRKVKEGDAEWTEYRYEERFFNENDANDELLRVYDYLEKVSFPGLELPNITDVMQTQEFTDAIKAKGHDGIIQSESGDEAVVFDPNQVKSAESNNGDFSRANNDIRFSITAAEDAAHADAIKRGDTKTAARLVREAAEKSGYVTDSSYQGTSAFNGAAPSANGYYANKEERKAAWEDGSFEGETTFGDYIFDGIDINNLDYILGDERYRRYVTPERKEAVDNLRKVLSAKGKTIRMYRSVPSNVKEGSFRNGDWITPSKSYAVENARIHGWGEDYRIIEQDVSVEDVWWDGNDVAEWGYDDGKEYAYRNTPHNRKLLAPATYDDAGDLIPLSQRFNTRKSDIRFSISSSVNAIADIANGSDRGIIHNNEYGDISYPLGTFGRVTSNGNIRHGLGLLHVVYARMAKDGASLDDAITTALKVAESAENGVASRDEKNRLWLDKDGVRAVIAKNADGKKIITGYEIYADGTEFTNRASSVPNDLPTPRLEDILSALKSRITKLSSTSRIMPQLGASVKLVDGQLRFSFAGVTGAKALGIGKADEAERMERDGATREEIWRKTGWWRGRDGRWRVEIDPPYLADRSKFEFLKGGELVRLGELFPDSPVIRAYGLERIPVITDFVGEREVLKGATAGFGYSINGEEGIVVTPNLVRGVYTKPNTSQLRMLEKISPEYAAFSREWARMFDAYDSIGDEEAEKWENRIRAELAATEVGKVFEDIRSDKGTRFIPSEHFLSVITHEIQHIIQEREGHAQGGNPGLFMKGFSTEEIDARIAGLNAELDKVIAAGEDKDAFDRLRQEIRDAEDEKWKAEKEARDNAVIRYRHLAGEVEARNVEKRLNMTIEKRTSTPPWETEDVNWQDQTLRFSPNEPTQKIIDELKDAWQVRFSTAQDSIAEKLDEQRKKIEANGGKLLLAHHGTDTRGFTRFEKSDDIGFFFSKNRSTAASYIRNGNHGSEEKPGLPSYDEILAYLKDEASGPYLEKKWWIVDEFGQIPMFPVDGQDSFDNKEDAKRMFDLMPSVMKGRGLKEGYAIGRRIYGENEQMPYDELKEIYLQESGENSGIYDVALKMTDPYEIDCRGSNWDSIYDVTDDPETRNYVFVAAEYDATMDEMELRYREYGEDDVQIEAFKNLNDFLRAIRDRFGDNFGEDEKSAIEKAVSAGEDFSGVIVDGRPEKGALGVIYSYNSLSEEGYYINPQSTRDIVSSAKEMGCDGVIFRNVLDNGGGIREADIDDVYVVMNPAQVKLTDEITYADDGSIVPYEKRVDWENDDMRFSIVGENGAKRSSVGSASEAAAMEKTGATGEDIWRNTGWWRGHDGKWRIEIPGYSAGNEIADYHRASGKSAFAVSDVLSDEASQNRHEGLAILTKAYPKLKKLTIKFVKDPPTGIDAKAAYVPDENAVEIYHRASEDPRGEGFSITHELQHAIQWQEGFSYGDTSATTAGEGTSKANKKRYFSNQGEIEAYLSQARSLMGDRQRSSIPPWETERLLLDSIGRQFGFRIKPGEIRFSISTPWEAGFPDATAQTTRKYINDHHAELFRLAKGGNVDAAEELVEKVCKPDKIRQLGKSHPNATIVAPVIAQEASGHNQIPRVFARYVASLLGIDTDRNIVQSVRANHTGSNASHRLFVNPEFDGQVVKGAEYIIVDDHITQGGTVNALRDHIESNGGKVVAVAALTLSQGSGKLSPNKDTLDELKRKWPDIDNLLRIAGIADSAGGLTQSQARYILKFSPDTFRNRAVAQGNDRGGRTRSETLGAPSTEKVKTSGRDSSKPAFSTVKPQTVASAYPRLDKLSDEQLIAAAVASKMVFGKRGKLKNKYANINEVQRYIKALHPGLDNLEVSRKTQEVLRAVREIGGRMKDDLARGVSESQILKNLPDRMKDVFTGEMTAEAIKGANIGSYQARARMKIDEKAAKVIEDAVAVQSGVETSLLENAYGIDFSQTIMSLEENPFLKKDGNGNFLPLPGSGSGFEQAEGQGQTTAKEEREVSQAIKKAVDEIAKRSKEQLETEDRNAETRRHESDDLSDNGENGGDIGDLTEGDIAAIATKRAGVDLRNPRQLALFIAELARRWWVKKNGLAQDAEAFRDRVALQFLRKTAANIYTKLVREITYSQSRDSATQAINGFDNAPTLRGLLSEMTYVGQLVNARKIRETQQGMCEKLDQLLREKFGAVGRFKADREELRRKVSAEMELRARYARHAIWLTPNAAGEEAQRLRDELDMVAANFETADHDANHSRVMEENLRKLNILREFGGLRYKPLADIEAALNYWDNALEGETDAIVRANYERDVRTKAAAALFAKAFHNPKRKYAREGGLVSSIGDYIQGHMSFTHLLRDMMRYAESEDSEKAEKIIQYLELEIQKAGTRSTTEQRKHANALAAAVKQLYGRDFTKILSEFAKEDERFAPFMGEKDGTKIRPTKGRAIQLMVSLLQVGHQVEVQDPNDPKKTVMQWVGGYHDNIVKHHREGQAERIAALLTPADLNLVKWIGQWYEANRQELSEECQALFGMGVYAETWNYFPVKMLLDKQGLEKGESVGWTIFPKALTPRVRNERDFDTEADVLQMFMSRMEEAAQWKAHAKLGLEMRGIFGRTELQNAVIASHGKKANDLMLGFITDILSGHGAYDRSPSGVEYYSDMIRGWAALGALGGNVGVMFKQVTSIPAFGFEIGLWNTTKHLLTAATPSGVRAMLKIIKSAERKNRWQTGNTEAVKNALATQKPGVIKKMLQASMITNKLGDITPALVIGQGIYRDALDRGMSEDEAMAYMWMLVERTQQSSRIENQTSFQRRAKLGRILYQFLSTQQQYLQYETRAIRKVIANPSLVNEEGRKRWMELGRAAVLNHFILSSAYFWMGQLYKRWLGQEPPEDELKDWTISCLLGPYGALFCAGFTCTDALNEWIKGPRYGGGSSVPSLSWAGNILVRDPAKLISTVFDDGKTFDDVLNEAAKFASDFNAIFRDLRKIYRWRIRKESQ